MKLFRKIADFLWVIVHPHFWFMCHPYSKEWDEWMQEMLQKGKFSEISEDGTARLNGVLVWIDNYPYRAFTNYPNGQMRPSRKTIVKLREKFVRDMIAEQLIQKETKNNNQYTKKGLNYSAGGFND